MLRLCVSHSARLFRALQGKGITIPTEESKKIQRREEDLNGVNPFYAMLGAVVAGAMSFGSWKVNGETAASAKNTRRVSRRIFVSI